MSSYSLISSIKLSFNGEIRRLNIPVANGVPSLSFSELRGLTKRTFNIPIKATIYTWTDEDGDVITVSSDEELSFAISCLHSQGVNVFKFQVLQTDSGASTSTADSRSGATPVNSSIHHNVRCDECNMSPIVGPRFKCSVRPDFDLCQSCEARRLQPYPMIKLYDADQSPMAILVAMEDRVPLGFADFQIGRRGCHGRGSHGPHGPRHGPPGGHHQKDGHHKDGHHKDGHHNGGNHRMPWAWRTNLNCGPQPIHGSASSDVPKVSAVPKRFQPVDGDAAATEQALFDQALKASIEEQQLNPQVQACPDESAQPTNAEIPNPANAASTSIPKSAMRVIRDVTFPDGTKVQPGSVFIKTWRVRNDGPNAWPAGTRLVTSGGDLLTPADWFALTPLASPGEEVDLSVTMTAPAMTGRHTAYFRLQNQDGILFGQRLWADVRVEEVDPSLLPSWVFLDNADSVFGLSASDVQQQDNNSASRSMSSAVSADAPDAPDVTSSVVNQAAAVVVPNPNPVPSASASASPSPSASTVSSASDAAGIAKDVWARVWAAELEVLAQMGFTDTTLIIPILQENIKIPASLTESKVVSSDAMQTVVLSILGMSI